MEPMNKVTLLTNNAFGNPHLLQGLLQICHHLIHYRWSSNSIIGIIILTAACYGWSSSFAVVCGWGVIVFRIGIITRILCTACGIRRSFAVVVRCGRKVGFGVGSGSSSVSFSATAAAATATTLAAAASNAAVSAEAPVSAEKAKVQPALNDLLI